MLKFIKANFLPLSVFITGACVLIVEVVATRILSPYFGNTMFTVSSVISVILAALSLGYYWGGTFADKHPTLKAFYGIILVSGLCLLVFHVLTLMTLPLMGSFLPITSGPLLSSVALFFLPALLLGTLSPYAVKLESLHLPKAKVGTAAGRMFFWSTLGSITGSLLAGFVLIPHIGINQIVVATAVVLFLLGLIPLLMLGVPKNHLHLALLVFFIIGGTVTVYGQFTNTQAVYSKDGLYEKIIIHDGKDQGRPVRFFRQDRSTSGAMFLDSDDPRDLVYDYTKYYRLYQVFQPEIKNALVIGGGAYSIPKALLADLPEATVDVSEIEPSLFELAQKYFQLKPGPRLHNYTDDGRRLLRDTDKRYDLIFSDVYYSLFSIPAHFTTQEFFTTAKDRLAPNGMFVANLIGDLSRDKPSLTMSEIKTFRSVFPNSYFFATESPGQTDEQNIIVVGFNSDKQPDLSPAALARHTDPLLRQLAAQRIDPDRFELSAYPILTDNFAPVEYLTSKLLKRTSDGAKAGDELLALIEQQLRYGPRFPGADGHRREQTFLEAEMTSLTPTVNVQSWQHTGSTGKTYDLKNIIARFNPDRTKRILLGTHYDTKRLADKDPDHPDQPVPGANDAASGAAVLVELARALSRHAAPNVGVDIVFFDGEEGDPHQGSDYSRWQPLGSSYFAEHLSDIYGRHKPQSGVVLDMVCDKDLHLLKEQSSLKSTRAEVDRFWTLGQTLNKGVFSNAATVTIHDDHTPLDRAGIPSFLVIDLGYPPFHTSKDTADKCSARSLETVLRTTLGYIYSSK
jgi:spermidine synthase